MVEIVARSTEDPASLAGWLASPSVLPLPPCRTRCCFLLTSSPYHALSSDSCLASGIKRSSSSASIAADGSSAGKRFKIHTNAASCFCVA